nr:MAG TPA: hypothetical protein [Caudoviricetes sp.]
MFELSIIELKSKFVIISVTILKRCIFLNYKIYIK